MGDLQAFVRQPKLWVRIIAAVCSIIVFGCIANKGWVDFMGQGSHCVFDDKSSACHFGVAIGVISLLGLLGFIIVDYVFAMDMLDHSHSRVAHMAELIFSTVWTIMWFTSFVFLADTWRRTKGDLSRARINNARSAVAFSFFSLVMFMMLVFMTARQVRNRQEDGYQPVDSDHGSGPAGYGGAAEPYQEPSPSGNY